MVVLLQWLPWYGKIFMVLWYGNLLFQTLFFHRYASHQTYEMSPRMVKAAFIGAYICQGSSYVSAYSYALLHRLHHAFSDTDKDPALGRTSAIYFQIFAKEEYQGRPIESKYKKNLPHWHKFDKFAHSWSSRMVWVVVYIALYSSVGYFVDHSTNWGFIMLAIIITCGMTPIQSFIINIWGHNVTKFPIVHIPLNCICFNTIMLGEHLHDHHHGTPSSPNFAKHWWEYDMGHTILWGLDLTKVIQLRHKTQLTPVGL